MFDIGWQELFLVIVLGIIVIGPKDLPRAIRTVTKALRKLRGLASDFQSSLDEVAREAELDDIRREFNKAAHYDVTREIKDNLDPDGELERSADIENAVRETVNEAKQASAAAAEQAKAEKAAESAAEKVEEVGKPAAAPGDGGDGSAKQANG